MDFDIHAHSFHNLSVPQAENNVQLKRLEKSWKCKTNLWGKIFWAQALTRSQSVRGPHHIFFRDNIILGFVYWPSVQTNRGNEYDIHIALTQPIGLEAHRCVSSLYHHVYFQDEGKIFVKSLRIQQLGWIVIHYQTLFRRMFYV